MARKIKMNSYGNWVGYVGRFRAEEFGTDDIVAYYWLRSGDNDWNNAYDDSELALTKQQQSRVGCKKATAGVSEKTLSEECVTCFSQLDSSCFSALLLI